MGFLVRRRGCIGRSRLAGLVVGTRSRVSSILEGGAVIVEAAES
jgi:hypothetical protein